MGGRKGLEYVKINDLTQVDLEWLDKALKGQQLTIQDILTLAENYVCQIWRPDLENTTGIMVTRLHISDLDEVPELLVVCMAGTGFYAHMEFFVSVLEVFAKAAGAKRIGALSKPGIVRFLKKRCGFVENRAKIYISKEV